jgi:hypothetical protein
VIREISERTAAGKKAVLDRPEIFGASSLLNEVLMQIEYQRTGGYQDPDHFTLD